MLLSTTRARLRDEAQPDAVVAGVEVVHWNPVRDLPDVDGRDVRPRPVANFGDLLGPAIVHAMAARAGLGAGSGRLLAVGSILHFAEQGDTVWGAGRNGKIDDAAHPDVELDVRAVRGPLTADWLRERGHEVPEAFGDPAMLVPTLFPATTRWAKRRRHPITVVPNLNDWQQVAGHPDAWHPRNGLAATVRRIAESAFVTGSSLHAIIVAEVLGVPVRPMASGAEHPWKYDDWFASSGRPTPRLAETVEEAVALGPNDPVQLDPGPIAQSFPTDLWSGRR